MTKSKREKAVLNSTREHASNLLDHAFGAVAPIAVKKPRKAAMTTTRTSTKKRAHMTTTRRT